MSDVEPGLGTLTKEDFEPLVGERLIVRHPDVTEELELTGVQPSANPPNARYPRAGFSLLLRGTTPDLLLLQGTHPFEHPRFGMLEIFMVPVARDPDGCHRYQIVFN